MVCVFRVPGYAQIILTFAGNGYGFSGDGGPATAALFNQPIHTARDNAGNTYIADYFNHRVRMVDPYGVITTVVGNGTSGYSGDGGPATAAALTYPAALALDAAGNLYISDYGNAHIRKVNTSGIISNFAGSGGSGALGDGGPATAAVIVGPWGLAIDTAGNVYVGQYAGGNRIRKISTSGIITTYAGTGVPGFSGDGWMATAANLNSVSNLTFDQYGNLYFGDESNQRVRKISPTGIITTVAGCGTLGYGGDGGPATAAFLYRPVGVAVDAAGNLYIGDEYNNRVRRVNTAGIISTIAGTGSSGFSGDGGPATAAKITHPFCVAIYDSLNLYICDGANNRIRIVPGYNRPPVFTGGVSQTLVVCQNSIATSINSLLAVLDSDAYQSETWSLLSGPAHGTAAVSFTSTSLGVPLTPSGLSYTPSSGYSGYDTFRVKVTDGFLADTISIYVTVNPNPSSIAGVTSFCVGVTSALSDATTGGVWSSSNTTVAPIGTSSGIVSGAAGGVATISYTISTGCAATVAVTVSTVIAPITGSATLCTGATSALSDASGGGVWSSSSSVAAIGSSTGIVSGIAAGTTTITYSTGGICIATMFMTVSTTPAPITGTTYVCTGAATTLSDLTPGGAWSSGAISIATVGSSSGVVTGVSTGMTGITYTIGLSCITTIIVTVNSVPATISGTGYMCPGGTTTLTAATPGGIWTSSNLTVAAIGSSTGIVNGISAGTDNISYTLSSGCYAVSMVTVNPTPSILGFTSVYTGSTSVLTSVPSGGIWSSSNPAIATIGSASGVVSGIAAGTANITYTSAVGCVGVAVGTVVNPSLAPQIIVSIAGNGSGSYSGDGGAATSAAINHPYDAIVDGSGNIYISDYNNNRIRKVNTSGIISTIAGTGSAGFGGDGGPATSAQLNHPGDMLVDVSGNLYFSDISNNRVRKVNSSGIISTIAGSSSAGFAGDGSAATAAFLNNPNGLAIDGSGNLYIADCLNNRIRKVNMVGVITTIAGTGTAGFGGDGGNATAALLHSPNYLAIDGAGNVCLSDQLKLM